MPALRSQMRAMTQLLLAAVASGLLIDPKGGLRTAGSPTLRAAASADALLQDVNCYEAASVKEQAILGRVNAASGVGKIDDLNAFNLGGTISKARELAGAPGPQHATAHELQPARLVDRPAARDEHAQRVGLRLGGVHCGRDGQPRRHPQQLQSVSRLNAWPAGR